MKNLLSLTIRRKLIFSFLSVSLLPLLVLALLNQRTMHKTLIANSNQTLLSAASQTAFSLDTFISTNLDAIRVEAQLPLLAQYLSLPGDRRQRLTPEVEAVLQALSRKDPLNITSYALLDRQGRDLVDTDRLEIGADKSNRDYFQQPLKTNLPYVSPIQISPTRKNASLYFSSPIRNVAGEIVGVLRLRYNAAVIQQLVNQNTELVGGLDTFAIVLDENYIRLAQGYSPQLLFQSVVPLSPPKVKALQAQGRLPQGSIQDLSTDIPTFKRGLDRAETTPFFTTPLAVDTNDVKAAAVTKLKTQPWFVVFVQSESSFLAPVQAQARNTLLLAIALAAIAMTAAIAIGQLLAEPLIALTGIVIQFTAGNLKARSPVRSNDEVGVLASSFNTMAEQIGKLLHRLEERTRELELSQSVTAAVTELSRSISDPQRLLKDAIALAKTRFNLSSVEIYLLERADGELVKQVDADISILLDEEKERISLDSNSDIVAQAARTQTMVWTDPTSEANSFHAQVAIPLVVRGTLLGVLDIQDERHHRFSQTDLETFKTLAGQIATTLETSRLFEEMQKAEERFRILFEDAPIGMGIASVEHYQLLQVNKAFCELLGYDASELMGKTFVEITHPDDLDLDFNLFRQLLAGEIASYQIEKRYFRQDGEIIWVNVTITLVRDRWDDVSYALGMIENVTERQRSQAALQQSEIQYREKAQELEQTLHELQETQAQLIQTEKMSSLGQLVAGVAHEINNPINFIYGNIVPASEYLQELISLLSLYQQQYPNPTPEIRSRLEEVELDFLVQDFEKILNSMKVGAERIRQIVLSLRNFSRLDEAEMKPVDIHEGIENTLVILQNQLKDKPGHPEIKVIKEYAHLPLIECYAGQLNQVFMNLLTNAIDSINEYNQSRPKEEVRSHPGAIKIKTQLLENKWVEIRIEDNGIGISPEVQKKLFNPFFTTKSVGKGTGLGLAISYQIVVEKHQGKLHCVSAPDRGAEFIIQIPIQ